MGLNLINALSVDGTKGDIACRSYYGECSTLEYTYVKQVTLDGIPQNGDLVAINFVKGNTYSSLICISVTSSSDSTTKTFYVYPTVTTSTTNTILPINPHSVLLFRVMDNNLFIPVYSSTRHDVHSGLEMDMPKTFGVKSGFSEKYYIIQQDITVKSAVSAYDTVQVDFTLKDTTGKYGMNVGICGWSSSSRYFKITNIYRNGYCYVQDTSPYNALYDYTCYLFNLGSASHVSSSSPLTFSIYFLFMNIYDTLLREPQG